MYNKKAKSECTCFQQKMEESVALRGKGIMRMTGEAVEEEVDLKEVKGKIYLIRFK